ncbi:hypothetical protein GCM10010981_31030 [Dyella nitratireducens]|uniref:Uncharacterized protein n=1 Tax=Dyella nitratireducens TaxID=1849580 RepID=A0ABQ1GA13_9GAMM|nr:hypothetical protein GCM10010981_31030 [Dyella nitratireducens]GLQ40460.1 hypothetical protein GCM10007902_03090 [Dyella nitratireducens]
MFALVTRIPIRKPVHDGVDSFRPNDLTANTLVITTNRRHGQRGGAFLAIGYVLRTKICRDITGEFDEFRYEKCGKGTGNYMGD